MQERRPAAALTARRPPRVAAAAAAAAATVVVVDQLTKTWALRALDGHDIHLVWTLRLHLVFNSGGAFSLGSGSPWFFAVTAAVLVGAMVVFGRRLSSPLAVVALGLVLGGALANLGDRLFRDTAGAVVDWIDLQWWPVFNVADAAIVVGGALLAFAGSKPDATT